MHFENSQSSANDPVNCLVIESDESTVDLLRKRANDWFDQSTFKIHLADNPETANSALSQAHFDIIITNLQFPNDPRQPADIIKYLRDLLQNQSTYLIALSDLTGAGIQIEALQAGADDYFTTDIQTIPPAVIQLRLTKIITRIKRQKLARLHLNQSRTSDGVPSISKLQEQLVDLDLENMNLGKKLDLLESKNNRLMRAFSMYVDPQIINTILMGDPMHWQKGQRQDITVLFSDLRGYTRMSSKMSSEDVISFLNEYFTAMTEVIMGYNGMVDKYMGDGIMCLFGAPMKDSNHHSNAVEAAIEMRNVFELWQANWIKNYDIKPEQGIGLASGSAVVGNLGGFQKVSYTAIGSVVNLASRLEGIAGAGDIVISDELFQKLNDEIRSQNEFEPLAPIPIKGLDGRHHIYRLSTDINLDDIVIET